MAVSKLTIEAKDLEHIMSVMSEFGKTSGQVIDDVLHNEGGEIIRQRIMTLLPRSGRKPWKGKATAAASTNPFQQDNGSLYVTVRSRPKWHYLYFPDDGTNTQHHRGNQQFMKRGAELERSKIVDLCINRLLLKLEE